MSEHLQAEPPTDQQKRVIALFADIESKQPDFLDQSAKSIIERVATFLAVLFGVTAFGNNFPPAYLKDNALAKIFIIITLVLYLAATAAGMWAIQPRQYKLYEYNLTGMREQLDLLISSKVRWLRIAGILFALGSVALAILIVTIIIKA